jgi:pimeloyl-ACP methyl ester carboxylesterase
MSGEFVVLLHGILRSKTDMLPMALYLKKNGYGVLNVLYPSRKKSLEDLTDFIEEKLKACKDYDESMTLHFVTHSMGGLIARYYIATRKPKNLGKVVMLGPPNTGSEFADFLTEHKFFGPIFKKMFGPASGQLTTKYKHAHEEINFPLGVIAGTVSINPFALWILPGAHDGIVPVERTRINGMRDHITVRSTHTFMMFNRKVMKQVEYFLKNEKFKS